VFSSFLECFFNLSNYLLKLSDTNIKVSFFSFSIKVYTFVSHIIYYNNSTLNAPSFSHGLLNPFLCLNQDSTGPVEIGIAALGINIYRDNQRELLFRWQNMHDFNYNRRKFTVKLKEPLVRFCNCLLH